ncbi:DUF6531 domain-containing protein [Microbulbifer sp. TYP-18]|uniref:DUF6531 domain-containing protein n=1 Tax=Microbulbifer sp. TYP-18 TaxID=3230024 RepID=UPI0034C61CA5
MPNCQSPTIYNDDTALCEKECPADKPWSEAARDCVAPPEPDNCSSQAGNPINFLSGHKLQRELVFAANGDFPLSFSWFYNSFGNHSKSGAGYSLGSVAGGTIVHSEQPLPAGEEPITLPLDRDPALEYTGDASKQWRHNHSYFLAHYTLADGVTERVIAYRPNGSDLHFVNESGVFVALANRNWQVTRDLDAELQPLGWTLRVDGFTERYDIAGRILRMENQQGEGISYTYDGSGAQQTSIADNNGNSITLAYTDGQLTQITRNDNSVYQFAYTGNDLLHSITFPGISTPQRLFRYEDSRFPNALTGVTDEAGAIYSSFAYDDLGRAIRTEHNGGAESLDVAYVDADTRRLTNALGKQTSYHYGDIDGVKRIVSIDGEASANCAAANRAYTYDSNGFVATETDWEGNITSFTRDNLGRELSRTEAAGTPEARTVTTQWHATLNLVLKITTPESVTDFTYDSSGLLLGSQTTPVVGP